MAPEEKTARLFVNRLLGNSAIARHTPLQKEEQVLRFMRANAAQLYPVLSSENFFPGRNRQEIMTAVESALYRQTDTVLFADLESYIRKRLDLGFIGYYTQQPIREDTVRERLIDFLFGLLRRPEARRGFTGVYAAIFLGYIDRYVQAGLRRKEYIHFELTKVQRLKMESEEIRHLVTTIMLLKPAIHAVETTADRAGDLMRGRPFPASSAVRAIAELHEKIDFLPEQLLRMAVRMNVSFDEDRSVEAAARLAAILAARCRNIHPNPSVDRGAEPPDASWFGIARKNCRYYGFDAAMVDECLAIADERGW